MIATGTAQLDIPRERLFARLSEPEGLEELLPAVERIERDGDELTVGVAPHTALGVTPLRLTLVVRDRRPNEHVRLEGSGYGEEFRTAFTVELDFASQGDRTEVSWRAQARFDGFISSIAQRILPIVLAAQIEDVLRAGAASLVKS